MDLCEWHRYCVCWLKVLKEQLFPMFIIYSAQFLPPLLELAQALPSSIVQVCLCCFGGVECLSGQFFLTSVWHLDLKSWTCHSLCSQQVTQPWQCECGSDCPSALPLLPLLPLPDHLPLHSRSLPCSASPLPVAFLRTLNEILWSKKLEWVVKSFLLPARSHLSLQLLQALLVIFTCRVFSPPFFSCWARWRSFGFSSDKR